MEKQNFEGQNGSVLAVALVIIAVVIVAGYILIGRGSDNGSLNPSDSVEPTSSGSATPTPTSTATASKTPLGTATQDQVKTFNVTGIPFSFSLKEIRVNKGDTVKIVFLNAEGLHDWVIDEFNAKTARIQAGQSETITFVADKTGTFEYYCSVGNHRAMGMKGKLIVN